MTFFYNNMTCWNIPTCVTEGFGDGDIDASSALSLKEQMGHEQV